MNIFSKPLVWLACAGIFLTNCASHPLDTAPGQSDAAPVPIVATCPTYSPTFHNVMAILHDHDIHCGAHISGTAWIYVYPEEAAKAREILANVTNEEKFKGLKVVK